MTHSARWLVWRAFYTSIVSRPILRHFIAKVWSSQLQGDWSKFDIVTLLLAIFAVKKCILDKLMDAKHTFCLYSLCFERGGNTYFLFYDFIRQVRFLSSFGIKYRKDNTCIFLTLSGRCRLDCKYTFKRGRISYLQQEHGSALVLKGRALIPLWRKCFTS